ncbi:MAG: flagellar biosynthesis protein FlgB [Acidobacteria bacterium]|nr:flagellar biosynthesis protein FlgB [Acidobacteriota bacterium]
MDLNMPMADALGRYLDLASQQMKVTAQNAANIDTPGYKTVGFDFGSEFQTALQRSGNVAPAAADVREVDGLVSRPDGNNVSMDREAMNLAKAQLEFRTGVELLKHEYSRMMSALRSDGK